MKSIGTLKIISLPKSFKAKSRNQSSNKEKLNNKPDRFDQVYSSEARSIVLSIIPIEHLIINSLGECIPILTNKETSDILELDLSINEVLYKGIINKKEIQKIFIDGQNYWNPDLKTFIILDCTPD